MRRWIGFAAKLYPRGWRQRYGEEFDALVEDVPPSWQQFTDVTRGAMQMQIRTGTSYLKLAGVLAVAGAIAAGAMSFRVPPRYVSSAVFQLTGEQHADHAISKEAMDKHLAYQLETLQRQVLSRGSLAEMALRPNLNLYSKERRSLPMEDILQQMRDQDIHLILSRRPGNDGGGASVVTVSFAHADPRTAQAVVSSLVAKFVDENLATYKMREDQTRAVWHQSTPIGERLEVLDPASLPKKPVGANRLVWIGAGLGGGLLVGLLIASVLRRPKWTLQIAACAAAGCAAGFAISLRMPNTYLSSTTMRITPSSDPKQITGEAPARSVPEWVIGLQQRILTRDSLSELIRRPALDLYKEQRARQPIEEVADRMRNRDIRIRMLNSPTGAESSFLIEFSYPDKATAQAVERELVSKLMEENSRDIRQRYETDAEFARVAEHKAGQNLEVLDPPSLPENPIAPNRLAVTTAGLLSGLLMGTLTLWLLQHRRVQGLQLSPEGREQLKP